MEENIVLSIEELQEKWFFNRFVRKLEREILNTFKIRENRKEFEEYYYNKYGVKYEWTHPVILQAIMNEEGSIDLLNKQKNAQRGNVGH